MQNFWQQFPKPILALAPMEDVTDTVFRQVVSWCASPDVFFTEFLSVEGFYSRGRDRVSHRLKYSEVERPLIAQIWGYTPEYFFSMAQELVLLGFDGIDINMGCPQRKIVKGGACAALIKNKPLAAEIIRATKAGIKAAKGDLPVSVKTRIGYNQIAIEEWIGFLLEQELDAISIHGRTAREMSAVPANWDEIGKAILLRNKLSPHTIILGNGDVKDAADGYEKAKTYGVDGVLIGRGIFTNLWAFDRKPLKNRHSGKSDISLDASRIDSGQARMTLEEMLDLLRRHMQLFVDTWGTSKNFHILRRFFKIYVQGFEGASELRVQLMETNSIAEVEQVLAAQQKVL